MIHDKSKIEDSDYRLFNDRVTVSHAAQRTLERKEYIEKNSSVKVVTMTDCILKRKLRENKSYSETFRGMLNKAKSHMDERCCVMGGRCDTNVLYFDINEHLTGMRGYHFDIISLYPWVCKRGWFPTGHPHVRFNVSPMEVATEKYRGIYYVTLSPPEKKMRLPTVPAKIRGKLMFSLCGTCAQEMNQYDQCPHEGRERDIGPVALTHFEFFAALADGYRLVGNVHTLLYYDEDSCTRYNQLRDIGGIFVQFINLFLKEKVEASGSNLHHTHTHTTTTTN
ncbi:MAG: hypothetical protein GY696_29310 [Gammaproteobacteria bacterium]|nr:hypothetical protein [Gammaproteobacteria bacterium]